MRALWLLSLAICAGAQQYTISTVAGGSPPVTPMPANGASIGDPARVTVDAAGNAYFSSLHSIFKADPSGTLTRIAGIGRAGNSGDGGPAISAQLRFPMGMALDSAGNLFVADRDANVVRRISTTGSISTVATGLNGPFAVAVDNAGVLYVADTGNDRIVKVAGDGTLTTVAGFGTLNRPEGVAVDASGTVYIADTFNGRIKRIASNGALVTVAGTGSTGIYSGDNGPAEDAGLSLPTDITFDRQGNLYIADFGNGKIRMVANGIISTALGRSNGTPIMEGEPGASVRLEGPTGVAVDSYGTIFFAEGGIGSGTGLAKGDYRVWKVPASGVLLTVAGNGVPSFAGDGGPAINAQLNGATAMSMDGIGNLYIADAGNNRIRQVNPDGRMSTLLGNGTPGFTVEFGLPAGVLVNAPHGVVAEPGGVIYFADSGNNRIRKYQPGGNVETWAGNGNASYFGDNGPATKAAVNQPYGVALDAAGNLYIADTLDNAVRKVSADGTITTIAGFGSPGFAGDGGPAIQAKLNGPRGVAVDTAGNVYVADSGNHRVRRIDSTGTIVTIAGNGNTDFAPGDSAGTSSTLSDPRGVAVDRNGNVYIADTGHNRIRKVFPSGAITTIAGAAGTCCYSGDGGPAILAELNQPMGLSLDSAGNLYVADAGNNAIRVLRPVPSTVTLAAVTNAASNATGPIAPGELVTLYGTGMDGAKSVLFNGMAGPLLYATTTQIGAVVPYGLTGASARVTVQTANATSAALTTSVAAIAPGIFTVDGSGAGQASALNRDGAANGPDRPARAGQTISLFVTGAGQTSPAGVDGKLGEAPLPKPVAPVAVTIGGLQAELKYAGGAIGLIAGVMQVDVVVPDRVFGAVPVVVSVGGVPSQTGVTIFVQ
jgi:trimeric autotransporter adhesin